MNKYFKGCLIVLGIGLLGIVAMMMCYNYDKTARQQQAQTDAVKYTETCDRNQLVTEQPFITITGFDSLGVKKLRFRLIRHGKAIQDTLVLQKSGTMYEYTNIQVPFKVFKKTDTIIVQTSGKHDRYFFSCLAFTTMPTCNMA